MYIPRHAGWTLKDFLGSDCAILPTIFTCPLQAGSGPKDILMSGLERLCSLFMSDFHLGSHHCKGERLYQFLCTVEADTICLVGDIIEMNVLTKWPPYYSECISELIRKTLAGTRIVYIPGNHDAIFLSHTGDYGRLLIETFAVHNSVNKKLLLVIHGDIIDRFKSQWLLNTLTWMERIGQINLWEIMRSYLGYFIRHHSDAFQGNMISFARHRGYTGIVCGHVHAPKISDVGGFIYLNCGDWTQHCTAISENRLGQFQMLNG